MPFTPEPIETRLWGRIIKTGEPGDECWEFQGAGAGDGGGYGKIKLNGRQHRAHRVAFYLTHGRWPEPFCLHRCDNPPCINPDHLREGTAAENTAEMFARKRHVSHRPDWKQTHSASRVRGERHHAAKLTQEIVRDVRRRFAEGATIKGLARELGVTSSTVTQALRGETWVEPGARVGWADGRWVVFVGDRIVSMHDDYSPAYGIVERLEAR